MHRCLICASYSLKAVCPACYDALELSVHVRISDSELPLLCFYSYGHYEYLFHSKFYLEGERIFHALFCRAASFYHHYLMHLRGEGTHLGLEGLDEGAFEEEALFSMLDSELVSRLKPSELLCLRGMQGGMHSLAIDDSLRNGTSLLARMQRGFRKDIAPIYSALRIKNKVHFAGRSRAYRERNRRAFSLRKPLDKNGCYVIMDDLVTTSISLSGAHEFLAKEGFCVPFGIALFDARE